MCIRDRSIIAPLPRPVGSQQSGRRHGGAHMISTAERRLVGVDLGIASDHTVRVLRGDGSEVCRRRARPTVESLTRLEAAALAGAPAHLAAVPAQHPYGV